MPERVDAQQMADVIDRFIDGTGGPYEWDDYFGTPYADARIEELRLECLRVQDQYPGKANEYCNAEGVHRLRQIAEALRKATSR